MFDTAGSLFHSYSCIADIISLAVVDIISFAVADVSYRHRNANEHSDEHANEHPNSDTQTD